MADFCQQCSINLFGEDYKDLAGITHADQQAQGKYVCVLCEGCGLIQVDTAGKCISKDCLKNHGYES